MDIFLLFTLIAGILALCILVVYLSRAKCPHCKSRQAEVVSRKFLGEEVVYFKVKEQIKEYENTNKLRGNAASWMEYTKPPERISVRERALPGKRRYYQVEYRCGNCGKLFSRKEYQDEKPRVE